MLMWHADDDWTISDGTCVIAFNCCLLRSDSRRMLIRMDSMYKMYGDMCAADNHKINSKEKKKKNDINIILMFCLSFDAEWFLFV